MTTKFLLNSAPVECDAPPGTPLVDAIRDLCGLTGTKVGCREGDCGACAVIVGDLRIDGIHYRLMNSCLMPLAAAAGRHVVSIEGLAEPTPTIIQDLFVEHLATQCGFCTPGLVNAFTAHLLEGSGPPDASATAAFTSGNLCRCTGYSSIRRVAEALSGRLRSIAQTTNPHDRVQALIRNGVVPPSFADAEAELREMASTPVQSSKEASGPLVAGGTDLFVQQPDALVECPMILLEHRQDLRLVEDVDGDRIVGAATTFAELEVDPWITSMVPRLRKFMDVVCSPPVRARATIGGNLVNASPIGDVTILLLALGASIELVGAKGPRWIRLEDFYLGYKNLDLDAGEVLHRIRIPGAESSGHTFVTFEKVCRRRHLDIASVNTALRLQVENGIITEARLSAGGVAPIPALLKTASAALVGRAIGPATAHAGAAAAEAEVTPIDDVRGTAAYKRRLLGRLVLAHFVELFPESCSEGLL